MFQIGDTLVALDIIERFFMCDLSECKGQCCIDGDAGAPMNEGEKEAIDNNLTEVIKLLSPAGKVAIENEGTGYIDEEGDLVTTLIEGTCCAFSCFSEDGICLCSLEKGYREGKLPMLKPSSCHLYPIRLKKIGDLTALNLHRWKICKSAEKIGRDKGVRVYEFLKEPLIRQFGEDWYKELELVAKEWNKLNS